MSLLSGAGSLPARLLAGNAAICDDINRLICTTQGTPTWAFAYALDTWGDRPGV
jgi:hypothetical protein